MENNNSYISSSDFRLLPGETSGHHRKPRKKRTKNINNALFQPIHTNFKPTRKPDPSAPKITRPCTECGRKFWSEKALFGHMRCHPERNWRGIVPPPNARRRADDEASDVTDEVAACLLMLASGPPLRAAASDTVDQECGDGRFECSSCKKVFGSHQALGGHRASHKNVKGCYAINKGVDDGEEFEGCCSMDFGHGTMKENYVINGHKCSICFRVFSSGQALGGHMRCHWEKAGEPSRVFDFDLNMDAALQDEDVCSSGMALDLRLGL